MSTPNKTVVIELTIRMLRDYPADWSEGMINFHLNESSHCLGTEIVDLAASDQAEDGSCDSCHRAEARYLRDATGQDIENLKLRQPPATRVIEIAPECSMLTTGSNIEGAQTPVEREKHESADQP